LVRTPRLLIQVSNGTYGGSIGSLAEYPRCGLGGACGLPTFVSGHTSLTAFRHGVGSVGRSVCGLLGLICTSKDGAAEARPVVSAAMHCQRHRGPDENRTWSDAEV